MSDQEQNFPPEGELNEELTETPTETPMERFFYHQRRALEETAKALEALLPPGFKEHATEASREFAKGFRVLVDATIDELKKVSEKDEDDEKPKNQAEAEPNVEAVIEIEETEEQPKPKTTGKTKVKVKVD
jgi:hypothetical protein